MGWIRGLSGIPIIYSPRGSLLGEKLVGDQRVGKGETLKKKGSEGVVV